MKDPLGNFRLIKQTVIASDRRPACRTGRERSNLVLKSDCFVAKTTPRNDNRAKFIFGISSLGLQIAFFSQELFACPMCSDLIERGKDAFAAMRFGQGIAWSMILMFGMPLLLASTLAFVIWRAEYRKKTSKELVHESKD